MRFGDKAIIQSLASHIHSLGLCFLSVRVRVIVAAGLTLTFLMKVIKTTQVMWVLYQLSVKSKNEGLLYFFGHL